MLSPASPLSCSSSSSSSSSSSEHELCYLLQDPYGFMAHFYVVAQYVSPVLAWGFLGTDEELKQVCEYFKVDIHSFSFSLLYFVFNLNYTHSWVNRPTCSLISQEMDRKTGFISILFYPRLRSRTKEMENVDPSASQIKDGKIGRFGFRPASSLISGGSACCSMLFCPRL